MKPINQDTYDLQTIIESGCIYVDKTAFFHRLITSPGSRFYFISRPRRFGKSLMIDTLRHIFQGDRELFKGLYIDRTDYEWEKVPVLHFDFSDVDTSSFKDFKDSFADVVKDVLEESGYAYSETVNPAINFSRAIKFLAKKGGQNDKKAPNEKAAKTGTDENNGVVVLIDEYDAPVCHALDNPKLAGQIRKKMADFYIELKKNVKSVRFLMMTGVSRVAKLSVFSALSNLVDITFEDEYATMLGFTEEELTEYFDEHIREHAKVMGLSYEEYRTKFKLWYDGYRFGKNMAKNVYNPVSASLALAKKERLFEGYWSSTGRSTLLANILDRNDIREIDPDMTCNISPKHLNISDFKYINSRGLLFQTGYLTIKEHYSDGSYDLRVPNAEVRQDFDSLYLYSMTDGNSNEFDSLGEKLSREDYEAFFEKLKAFYAGLYYGPNEKVLEYGYQRILLALLREKNFTCTVESQCTGGRSDIVAENHKSRFIFELKMRDEAKSAGEAIAQIKSKNYAGQYMAEEKPIHAIGLLFDRKTRQLIDAAHERLA